MKIIPKMNITEFQKLEVSIPQIIRIYFFPYLRCELKEKTDFLKKFLLNR